MDIPTIETLEADYKARLQALDVAPIKITCSLRAFILNQRAAHYDGSHQSRDTLTEMKWRDMMEFSTWMNEYQKQVLAPALDKHRKSMSDTQNLLKKLLHEKKRLADEMKKEAKEHFEGEAKKQKKDK